MAKSRLPQAIDAWKLGLQPEGEMVPVLQTRMEDKGPGQEGWKCPWSISMEILPQEIAEDKVGLGVLPILEMAVDDILIPSRTDLAKEMTSVLQTFRGRCTWKRGNTTKLSSFFAEGEEVNPTNKPTMKQLKDSVVKYSHQWPDLLSKPQKRKGETKIVPVEVRRDKYSKEGRYLGQSIRELGLTEEMNKLVLDLANCSLARSTWRAYSTAERAAER